MKLGFKNAFSVRRGRGKGGEGEEQRDREREREREREQGASRRETKGGKMRGGGARTGSILSKNYEGSRSAVFHKSGR